MGQSLKGPFIIAEVTMKPVAVALMGIVLATTTFGWAFSSTYR
jgi:hypothetical protein